MSMMRSDCLPWRPLVIVRACLFVFFCLAPLCAAHAEEETQEPQLPVELVKKLRYISQTTIKKSLKAFAEKQTHAVGAHAPQAQERLFDLAPYQLVVLSALKPFNTFPEPPHLMALSKSGAPQSAAPQPGMNAADINRLLSDERVQDTKNFCAALASGLKDKILALQKNELLELKVEIDTNMTALNARMEQYKKLLQQRDDELRKIDDNVVAIYTKMRPETAASQIAMLDNKQAATLLFKLNPKTTSLILNEMDPAKAALLTDLMTSLTFTQHEDTKS